MHPTLTPRPTEAEISAHALAKDIGLDWAKAQLNEAWVKQNITQLKARLRAAAPGTDAAVLAFAMVDLLTIFETAMDDEA